MLLVKLEPILHRDDILFLAGGPDQFDGLLLNLNRFIKLARFSAGHGQRIQRGGLLAAGQFDQPFGKDAGFRTVASLRIFIRRPHIGRQEKHLKIVWFKLQGGMQLCHGFGVIPLLQQKLAHQKMRFNRCRIKLLGGGKLIHGFIKTPQLNQDDTIFFMHKCQLRFSFYGLLIINRCQFRLAFLIQCHGNVGVYQV